MVDSKKLPGRFRLLAGGHTVKVPDGENQGGKPVYHFDKYHANGTGKGDVVISETDLEVLNGGTQKKIKFQYIGPASVVEIESGKADPDGLGELTIAQLQKKASDDGISLEGVSLKSDIIDVIRSVTLANSAVLDEGELVE